MGSKSRQFNVVFARAQEILRKTLGMELVELQNRVQEKEDAKDKEKEKDGKQDKKDVVGMKKKGAWRGPRTLFLLTCSAVAPTGTKSYMLRSVLDPRLIQIASSIDHDILRIEQADLSADDQHALNDSEETSSEPTGAILAWEQADSLGTVGLLYVVLSLILVHGRALADSKHRPTIQILALTSILQTT